MPIPARFPEDAAAERAAFARYLRTGRRAPPLELKFNPNHDPETGRFTFAEGGGATPEGVQEAHLSPGAVLRRAGKLAGVAFPPLDAGSVIVDNIVGAPLASDMLPTGVLIAENNKQKRAKIRGLQGRINEHRHKLQTDPDDDAANHWRTEIRAWTAQIEHIRKGLPGGR